MNWLVNPLKKYVVFSGRASRKEYWMFVLWIILIYLVLVLLDNFLKIKLDDVPSFVALLSRIWAWAVALPLVSICVRRLHDTSRSAWWLMIGLVPVLGLIGLFVYMIMNGTTGNNKFGLDPNFSS
ncbi:MAG: DUF805 domain-containing protein [Kaiparowitsia implicata GSE-PSE-MK54-09C]|nr:DUF805 domain-containing protein [Kaiparowitsia implicata GSE-PSE-MK54-09C]